MGVNEYKKKTFLAWVSYERAVDTGEHSAISSLHGSSVLTKIMIENKYDKITEIIWLHKDMKIGEVKQASSKWLTEGLQNICR